jgi:serine/threonine protein kinase
LVTEHLVSGKLEANRDLGYVFEAIDKNTGTTVALKRTMKAGNVVSREYEVLSLLKGAPNVVQLLDFFYSID